MSDYNDIIEELYDELEAAHKATDDEEMLVAVREKAKKLLADGEITDQDLEIFLEYDKEYTSGPNFRKNTKKGDTK